MSINVTVSGNPISIRRGKMVLSDLDIIKKNEREQRKRLRLEQVHEQSRAISKRLLERARRAEQEQLNRLQYDCNTEMKKAHNKRLIEAHRRYQDIENIGYAHENATKQPDVETIKRDEEHRNKAMAIARGTDAIQRLQESNKVTSQHSKQLETLQKVRDLENKRSKMVAQLPKKACFINNDPLNLSENENNVEPLRTRQKSKKSMSKEASKSNKDSASHTKTLSGISVTVNDEEQLSDTIKQDGRQYISESDDNEPRKIVPVTSIMSDKLEKLNSCSKEHYQNSSSSDLSDTVTASSTISSDSTYFSDNAFKTRTITKTSTYDTSAKSKINLYDHNTRQRNNYNTPSGLVEKMNSKNKSADELAEEIKKKESQTNAFLANQKEHSKHRSQDAILREKIRRDYEALLKQMDQLSKEERKLKANQVSSAANKPVLPPSVLAEKQLKRQKKMDRVFQNILSSSRNPTSNNFQVERPITITPRDYIHSQTAPATVWRESPYVDGPETEESQSEEDGSYIHKLNIFELLTKVDKLKRKLLQEYGTNLPDCVFNASVKSLFHSSSTSNSQEKLVNKKIEENIVKPEATPSQVINTANGDDTKTAQKTVNKIKKVKNIQTPGRVLSKKLPARSTVTTRDQEIQVEIVEDQIKHPTSTPLEPVVKIITPKIMETRNNISSDSSTTTDLLVDVGKKEITVIPKERESSVKISKDGLAVSSVKSSRCSSTNTPVKISFDQNTGNQSFELVIDPNRKEITFLPKKRKTEVASKKLSPISINKPLSLPGSRTSSPVKKLSRSAPPSRQCSPKKTHLQVQKKQQETHVEGKKYKSQCTQVSINSSTESSQLNSTAENLNTKFHRRFRAPATKRIIKKLPDNSDTSTTYASPPTATPGALLSAINSSTTILELLDSSANETLKNQRMEVSPVSSPETPSPRTMRLPSNIPKSNKVCKSLKYTSFTNTQTKPGSSQTSRSTRTTFSTIKDRPVVTQLMPKNKSCICKNPACKLFHEKIEDTQVYAAKNCPEVLKKLEDLQTGCMERIASLTDLIEKVRNEQKGFEVSVVTNDDSNSASQIIANSQSSANGDVGKVVKNVEAIYAQLRRTLLESKTIISGQEIEFPKSIVPYNTIEKSPSLSFDFSKDTTTSGSVEIDAEAAKGIAIVTGTIGTAKPTIVSDEKVQIKLGRFRPPQLSKSTEVKDSCRSKNSSETPTVETTTNTSNQNCDMVEKLSQEILEQSKSINKSIPVDSVKNSDDSLLKLSQMAVKDSGETSQNNVSNEDTNQFANSEMNASDYIPLLAGIPKIQRTKGGANGRGRPPVTLINGPYRQNIASPVHELSTIVEFDTPDTVNKSQISSRSPSTKCRRKLLVVETTQTPKSSPSKKVDVKSTESKPSVRVCPFPLYQSPQGSLNLSNKSTTKSIEKSSKKSTEMTLDSLEKKEVLKSESKKSECSDSMYTLSDVHIDQLQQSFSNAGSNYECRISQISEVHSLLDDTIEQMMISEIREESKSISVTPVQRHSQTEEPEKDKGQFSSTSSASFSVLSGVAEITSNQSSEKNLFKCPSSPEEMELALKKWGLGWAIPTLKKTREASALGSSSSSDVTPVNTGAKLVSPTKKHQDGAGHELSQISDVSSISIKHANKSTERSVLVKGRTSTPNRLSNTNSDGTVSTLSSLSSDFNIVVQNQSAEITIPNISFSNDKFA